MKICLLFFNFLLMASTVIAQTSVLITYHSETGNTEKMAQAVAEGANSVEGVSVKILTTAETRESDLLEADAIIIGSPVHNANVSAEVQRFIASLPFEDEPLKNKIGAVFVTGGGISAGEEIVQMNMIQSMLVFGMIIVGGPDWTQPFGASAITSEPPFTANSTEDISDQFLQKGRLLGKRVAEISTNFSKE
ncbi:flavodoxin family protein [Rhodohalobacter sp. 614A]|uniref:flavodoxin family protein n=1 Tax=Rhodohalobacter sp. 614A TaxID=2908649 RepID=UPI001F2557D8|nr:flavodoxin family protein [Rhodohalobacter sp. 614A]